MKKKANRRLVSGIVAVVICLAMLVTAAVPAFAQAEPKLPDELALYDAGGMVFEKISHPTLLDYSGKADGVVDYIGKGDVAVHDWQNADSALAGDRGQSYSYASASYGDWVYINTMYGGLGVSAILGRGLGSLGPEAAKALMDIMYNGHLYTGEPDGAYAGGILFKVNVKTGEVVLLMSAKLNGLIPTFRNAIVMDNKLYFVGMVLDMKNYPGTPEEMARDIAVQNAMPCLYEIDPENNDKMTPVYFCVDADGYLKLKQNNIFTSTRAICTFEQGGEETMIFGGLDADNGAYLLASKDPSAGQDSFSVIATMEDFKNYPAIHRQDVNGGGGIYQVLQYKDKVYAVVCAGKAGQENAYGTKQSFALFRGECAGDPTLKSSWTWTEICGDTDNGARYSFGIDPERISCGACTLQVYGDNLYIGDYNDVSSALQGIAINKNMVTQATNLKQSINLYRMDEDENIEMLVGDPTAMFPEGGSTGIGSGYGNHMNQYTWQTAVYEGKMYVGTMDTTTLIEPVAQLVNGDLIHMPAAEWKSLIGYIGNFIKLVIQGKDSRAVLSEADALSLVNEASASCGNILTKDQINALVKSILNGELVKVLLANPSVAGKLNAVNTDLAEMAMLLGSKDKETFAEKYIEAFNIYDAIRNLLPESVRGIYDILLKVATKQNMEAMLTILRYSKDSVRGFDLYEIEEKEDGTVTVSTKTINGFGDSFNHGLRIFALTDDYLLIGTANPFYGTQLWRHANSPDVPVDPGTDPTEPVTEETTEPTTEDASDTTTDAPEETDTTVPDDKDTTVTEETKPDGSDTDPALPAESEGEKDTSQDASQADGAQDDADAAETPESPAAGDKGISVVVFAAVLGGTGAVISSRRRKNR